MLELIEKVVMTTIGVAAITQKKAEELVCEMKDRYKMSEEEGKHLIERIQSMAKENKDKVREMAEVEVQKVVERLGLVSVEDLETLKKRVQDLEARFNG
jgi:polyhydroxyalkanoate synthesis regulator phasin